MKTQLDTSIYNIRTNDDKLKQRESEINPRNARSESSQSSRAREPRVMSLAKEEPGSMPTVAAHTAENSNHRTERSSQTPAAVTESGMMRAMGRRR